MLNRSHVNDQFLFNQVTFLPHQ